MGDLFAADPDDIRDLRLLVHLDQPEVEDLAREVQDAVGFDGGGWNSGQCRALLIMAAALARKLAIEHAEFEGWLQLKEDEARIFESAEGAISDLRVLGDEAAGELKGFIGAAVYSRLYADMTLLSGLPGTPLEGGHFYQPVSEAERNRYERELDWMYGDGQLTDEERTQRFLARTQAGHTNKVLDFAGTNGASGDPTFQWIDCERLDRGWSKEDIIPIAPKAQVIVIDRQSYWVARQYSADESNAPVAVSSLESAQQVVSLSDALPPGATFSVSAHSLGTVRFTETMDILRERAAGRGTREFTPTQAAAALARFQGRQVDLYEGPLLGTNDEHAKDWKSRTAEDHPVWLLKKLKDTEDAPSSQDLRKLSHDELLDPNGWHGDGQQNVAPKAAVEYMLDELGMKVNNTTTKGDQVVWPQETLLGLDRTKYPGYSEQVLPWQWLNPEDHVLDHGMSLRDRPTIAGNLASESPGQPLAEAAR